MKNIGRLQNSSEVLQPVLTGLKGLAPDKGVSTNRYSIWRALGPSSRNNYKVHRVLQQLYTRSKSVDFIYSRL